MKLLIALPLSCAMLFGQTCASLLPGLPSPFVFNEPHYGPAAPGQAFTIAFSGGMTSWTRVCPCGTYGLFTDITGGSTASTATTAYLALMGADQLAIGTSYTDTETIQFNPSGPTCSINATFNVIATGDASNHFTNNKGVADSALAGSSSTGGRVIGNDLITPSTIGALPGGSDQRPANGTTVTTTEWGTKIKTCSPPGYVHLYSSINALNSDNSVIAVTALRGGGLSLIDTATCSAHAISAVGLGGSTSTIVWDYAWGGSHVPQNNRAWAFQSNTLIQLIFNFTSWTAVVTTPYTYAGATVIGNGASDDIRDLGYIAFVTDKNHSGNAAHPQVCTVQIITWAEACIDGPSTYPDGFNANGPPNYVMASPGFDSRTGKMYVFTNTQSTVPGNSYGPRYSFHQGDTSLTFEDYFGIGPEALMSGYPSGSPFPAGTPCTLAIGQSGHCEYTGAHSHTAEDSSGRQYWVNTNGMNAPSAEAEMILDMSFASGWDTVSKYITGLGGTGGLDVGIAIGAPAAGPPFSGEMGCIHDWCVFTGITETQTSWKIIAASASAGTSTLTLDSAPGSALVTGNSVVIGNVGGCTQLNSSTGWTGPSVTVSGSTVTITGTGNCPTSYAANTGVIAKNVYPSTFSYRQEAILLHILNGSTVETRRLGNTYQQNYSDTYTEQNYWGNVGCTMTHDQTMVACNSNGGKGDEDSILLMGTGIIANSQSAQAVGAVSIQAVH